MTVTIPLSKGFSTVVDDDDAHLADLKWFANVHPEGHVYAVRNKRGGGLIGMHRVITDAATGLEVDHINGDTLNNRRANLRVVTRAQNAQNLAIRSDNKSGYRGVSWQASTQTWQATVQRGGKIVYSERFSTLDDAVLAVRLSRKHLLPFDAQGVEGVDEDAPLPTPALDRRDKTHCCRGHELAGDNVRIQAGGGRCCRACGRARSASRQQPYDPARYQQKRDEIRAYQRAYYAKRREALRASANARRRPAADRSAEVVGS